MTENHNRVLLNVYSKQKCAINKNVMEQIFLLLKRFRDFFALKCPIKNWFTIKIISLFFELFQSWICNFFFDVWIKAVDFSFWMRSFSTYFCVFTSVLSSKHSWNFFQSKLQTFLKRVTQLPSTWNLMKKGKRRKKMFLMFFSRTCMPWLHELRELLLKCFIKRNGEKTKFKVEGKAVQEARSLLAENSVNNWFLVLNF